MEEFKVRVRYGYVGTQRKNVLATIEKDGIVFFGISRCNLSVDRFDPVKGKKDATGIAYGMLQQSEKLLGYEDVKSGLEVGVCWVNEFKGGVVRVEKIRELLNQFSTIEEIALNTIVNKRMDRKY